MCISYRSQETTRQKRYSDNEDAHKNKRIVWRVIIYAVRAVYKESRRLIFPIHSTYLTTLSLGHNERRALISLWLFLFAAQPKEFFLDGLKKLEQRNTKCVELRGNM
jgi:hypothetical protein